MIKIRSVKKIEEAKEKESYKETLGKNSSVSWVEGQKKIIFSDKHHGFPIHLSVSETKKLYQALKKVFGEE